MQKMYKLLDITCCSAQTIILKMRVNCCCCIERTGVYLTSRTLTVFIYIYDPSSMNCVYCIYISIDARHLITNLKLFAKFKIHSSRYNINAI